MDKRTFFAELKQRLEEAKAQGEVKSVGESPVTKLKETIEKAKAEGRIKQVKSNPLLEIIKELKGKQIKQK